MTDPATTEVPVASEPESARPCGGNSNPVSVVALIKQTHGGALMPGARPGEVRNPAGRPTDAERLLQRLVRRHPGVLDDAADELAAVLRDRGSRHWMAALKETLDRTEGTVHQSTHHHISTDRAIITHAGPAHPPALPGTPDLSERDGAHPGGSGGTRGA